MHKDLGLVRGFLAILLSGLATVRFFDGSLFYVLRGWRPSVKGKRSSFSKVYRHDLKLQK